MKNVWKVVVGVVVVMVGMMEVSGRVMARAGDLDTTFGLGGKVTTDFSGQSDYISVVVKQQDGKLLVGGTSQSSIALARYNSDGSLDESFGLDGKAVHHLGMVGVSDLKVIGDKIFIVGTIQYLNSYWNESQSGTKKYLQHVMILRLNLDGTLDTNFGNGGYSITNFGTYINEIGNAIAIQNDGKIIVSGYRETLDRFFQLSGPLDFMTLRFTSSGFLDTTFGSGGIVTTLIAGGISRAVDVAIQADGKIIVVGSVTSSSIGGTGGNPDFAAVRYNENGTLDSSFDFDGRVVISFSGYQGFYDRIYSVKIQDDGKILLVGDTGYWGQQNNFATVRLNSNGTLDNAFGNFGKVMTNFPGYYATARDLILSENGSIIVGGNVQTSGSDSNFALAKYDDNGNLDPYFGTNGIISLDFYNTVDYAYSMTITDDQGVILAGSSHIDQPYTPSDFALLKIKSFEINNAPLSHAGGDIFAGEGGETIWDGSNSTDPDGFADIVSYNWDFGDGQYGSGVSASHVYADDGVYTATLMVIDTVGHASSDTATVTVNNVTPIVSVMGVTIDEGGAYLASGSFTDPGADTWTATVDYEDGSGIQSLVLSGKNFNLDHTYLDEGNYVVTVTVTDNDLGMGVGTATVTVNNLSPTIGVITAPTDPTQVGTVVNVNTSFTDPGILDIHTAAWDWGDEQTSGGALSEAAGSGTVVGSHAYSLPGVYKVLLTVDDGDGGVGQATYEYVVIYDPNGGFVTGAGIFNSPTGAYTSDMGLSGMARFGFTSKYQNGAQVPTGVTKFAFKVADFNFESTSYDWLVVAGAKAQYKGIGSVNDTGDYGFILTAHDSAINGGDDTFRIKIWDRASGYLVYDNMLGGGDGADPTTTLTGGQIVIHN